LVLGVAQLALVMVPRSAEVLHGKLLTTVMNAPLSFFTYVFLFIPTSLILLRVLAHLWLRVVRGLQYVALAQVVLTPISSRKTDTGTTTNRLVIYPSNSNSCSYLLV
jgi:hypothetical protein